MIAEKLKPQRTECKNKKNSSYSGLEEEDEHGRKEEWRMGKH